AHPQVVLRSVLLRSASGSHPAAVSPFAAAGHGVPPGSVLGGGPQRRWQTAGRSGPRSASRLDLWDLTAPLQKTVVSNAPSTQRKPFLVRRSDRMPHTRQFAEDLRTVPETASARRARGPDESRILRFLRVCRTATGTLDDFSPGLLASARRPGSHRPECRCR